MIKDLCTFLNRNLDNLTVLSQLGHMYTCTCVFMTEIDICINFLGLP